MRNFCNFLASFSSLKARIAIAKSAEFFAPASPIASVPISKRITSRWREIQIMALSEARPGRLLCTQNYVLALIN